MSADWTPPGFLKHFSIESRARRYQDPVQKLAYLKKAANKPARRLHISWYSKLAFLFLVIVCIARFLPISDVKAGLPRLKPEAPKTTTVPARRVPAGPLGTTWPVEQTKGYDVYSNGLRIENEFLTPNKPRSYVVFHNGIPGQRKAMPAGIIFHTSESPLAPFKPDHNDRLTRIGRDLLTYVSREHCYHFLIDRFGRVFRTVPETDSANHAGYSVWADQQDVYVNLNHSFLGISFEAQTADLNKGCYLSQSQIHSGRLLVEMLVSKYKIPLNNCVTHAQVSVDPDTMTIGHHTDGSGDFPFAELGVPNNYDLPIPSLYLFGFDFDSRFLMLSGTRMWRGLLLADERLRREAGLRNLTLGQYKETLRANYRTSVEKLKTLGIIKEN